MTDSELFEAITMLYMFDSGEGDPGIQGEALRIRVKTELTGRLSRGDGVIDRYIEELVADRSLESGFRVASVRDFAQWLRASLGIET